MIGVYTNADIKHCSLVGLPINESFVGVERRKSAAASPTKRIEPTLTLAVGEAIASKPMLNTNCGENVK